MSTQIQAAPAGLQDRAAASRLGAAALALFLGSFILWGVGFAGNERLHNAAHDTRHSNGFPCH